MDTTVDTLQKDTSVDNSMRTLYSVDSTEDNLQLKLCSCPFTADSTAITIYWTFDSEQHTIDSIISEHYTVDTIQWTLYSGHSKIDTIQWTL